LRGDTVFIIMAELLRKHRWLWLLLIGVSLAAALQAEDLKTPPKIGLVLSGGGARAASHIGVLKVLEREGISIDCIAATSMGALVGGLYSMGYSPVEIESFLASQDWSRIFSDAPQRQFTPLIERGDARYQGKIAFRGWNPELPSGLWSGQPLTEALNLLTTSRMLRAQNDFDKLPIPFRAVATNLINGKPYVFKKGSMTLALRASMAVPMMFTPLETDGMLLVDGGLVDNLPADIAREMGADIIIAVDATSPLLGKKDLRTLFDVVDQSISLQMEKNVQENSKLATLILRPELKAYTNIDYDKIPEIIKQGEAEATRHLQEIKALFSVGLAHRQFSPLPAAAPFIDSISFRGLKQIPESKIRAKLDIRPGDAADPSTIGADVSRIYATRLFESVDYTLEPAGENRYHLIFLVKEELLNTLGAGIRYDNDYKFVVLAEFTARQIFHTSSKAMVSSQFGGLEDHSASLRFIPPHAEFLFLEPKIEASRRERLDIRNEERIDKFTDKREGGQFMIGGSVFRQLELSGGYRYERVRISGGSDPNRMTGSQSLGGMVLRLNWDSLDYREFPRSGSNLKIQFDKQMPALGGDFDYSRWQADYGQSLPVSAKSTIQVNLSAGYSKGSVPFYDSFFVGGYSQAENASRQFLGFGRDEILVHQMAIIRASYRRQVFSRPLSLIKRGFLIATYNGGLFSDRQASPYRFNYLNGAGLGLSIDTMLGPLRASLGWGEGGRLNFYLSFGPSF
jgi:NTE family protein